jgi:hypothetical protein
VAAGEELPESAGDAPALLPDDGPVLLPDDAGDVELPGTTPSDAVNRIRVSEPLPSNPLWT